MLTAEDNPIAKCVRTKEPVETVEVDRKTTCRKVVQELPSALEGCSWGSVGKRIVSKLVLANFDYELTCFHLHKELKGIKWSQNIRGSQLVLPPGKTASGFDMARSYFLGFGNVITSVIISATFKASSFIISLTAQLRLSDVFHTHRSDRCLPIFTALRPTWDPGIVG